MMTVIVHGEDVTHVQRMSMTNLRVHIKGCRIHTRIAAGLFAVPVTATAVELLAFWKRGRQARDRHTIKRWDYTVVRDSNMIIGDAMFLICVLQ